MGEYCFFVWETTYFKCTPTCGCDYICDGCLDADDFCCPCNCCRRFYPPFGGPNGIIDKDLCNIFNCMFYSFGCCLAQFKYSLYFINVLNLYNGYSLWNYYLKVKSQKNLDYKWKIRVNYQRNKK